MEFTFNDVHYKVDRITFRLATLIEGAYGGPIKEAQKAAKNGEAKAIVALIYGVVHGQDPRISLDDVLDSALEDFKMGTDVVGEETDFTPAPEDPSVPVATT